MAPGLNGRQTGTVPKNKSRSCTSQSQRTASEPHTESSHLESEHMSGGGHKNQSKKNSSSSRSETEADSLRQEPGSSRSSTMTSLNGNGEGCSQEGFGNRSNVPDRKQVTNKLSQIQSYIQQTAALMNSLKASESPLAENQYKKLSAMLEELKDSESKLSALLRNMSSAGSRFDITMLQAEELKGSNGIEAEEQELARRSRESKKKLEVLQKRKEDLLKLQEKAKKQLQEAQAEQSRLVAHASSLNQELNANKTMDLNVQQLSQRLKAMQEMYNTRNQISDNLNESRSKPKAKAKPSEENQTETSDTETDIQMVADKMEELDEMKAQLNQIQKLMASISSVQNTPENASENTPQVNESGDDSNEGNRGSHNSSFMEGMQNGEDGNNNMMKLEQAKSKLNYLTELLEIAQSAQNTTGLSPSYMQLLSNLMNEEANSYTESPSPDSSERSPQRNAEAYSVNELVNERQSVNETMNVMTKELEDTKAAMKEERDRLLMTRQELQDIARRLPILRPETERVPHDCDLECGPAFFRAACVNPFTRDNLNGLTEAEQSLNCIDSCPYNIRAAQNRNRQRAMWNSSSPGSNFTAHERRSRNDSFYRGSNQSSRGGSRVLGRDLPHWYPSLSDSSFNERPSALTESQQQLEMSGNICEMLLSDSLQRGVRPNDISLQEMFTQYQLLTRTIAQCSQLLWLQQKEIIELRNAFMHQCGPFSSEPLQSIAPTQTPLNLPATVNPFSMGPPLLNARQIPPVTTSQQHQNFSQPLYENIKPNAGDIQNIRSQQDFPEQYLPHGNQPSLHLPEGFGCDMRSGNYNRFNPSGSNANHNFHQNLSSGFNNRGPGGINSVASEDSGALNNQVPPGNRANNYWDNFRSYSRQNLLSNTKSNEDSEQSRRWSGTSSQDRSPRDFVPSSAQNNQSGGGTSQQFSFSHGNSELVSNDQFLRPPSQNARVGHHSQVTRSCPMEPQNHRNAGKNESRHQDNESRNLNAGVKNESSGGGRSRNPDSSADIRSVRNDVGQSFRNTDNLNSSRNFMQLERDIGNEEVAQGNNKKRLERSRCRNDGPGNLNNRGYHNISLWESIYSEVSNFIRANESRPHFLLQLFRDLQQITTDSLRQRTLVNVQETVSANNLIERTPNMGGGNVNIIENRNNIRENRSNLNRNQSEDPTRIDELFCHLRENQNTIRQNIGMSSYMLGGNLENPNISNIRDLGSSRNNLESEGLRDLRTYFEANLCNFGQNSTLENPNLSNIRENLTRRGSGISDLDNPHPKNVYLSIYDNAAELRRRNQESSAEPGYGFRNFESESDCIGNFENVRESNNHFELDNNFEGAVGGRGHFQQDSRPTSSGFPVMDAGDNFARSRQFLGNDSGIDINFNNEERKRGFMEGDVNVNESAVKAKKNGVGDVDDAEAAVVRGEWDRSSGRDTSFDSSLSHSRKEMSSPFLPISDNSFFHCRTFQQSDNGDLAEADQSRNEETSGAEADTGFINAQIIDSGVLFTPDQNRQSSGDDFSSQNVPEAERNFSRTIGNVDYHCAAQPEGSSASGCLTNSVSNSDGNAAKLSDGGTCPAKNDSPEKLYYQLSPFTSSESCLGIPKSGVKSRKRAEDTADRQTSGDSKKTPGKSSTNKFRDGTYSQGKYNAAEDLENRKSESDSAGFAADGRQPVEGRDSAQYSSFQFALEKVTEAEKGNASPEAESDWECNGGLDQVPTRLNESGSSSKSSVLLEEASDSSG